MSGMNVRNCLKCEVCGSITLVRTQLGYLEQHPIKVNCGKCGILISGTVFLNPEKGTSRFEFYNAKRVEEITPDFNIEVSGELLTEKLQVYNHNDQELHFTSPYFESRRAMNEEAFLEFMKKAIGFLNACKEDWPTIRRIHELWLRGDTQYLTQEVHKLLPQKQFPMDNVLENIRGVRQLNLHFFLPILNKKFLNSTTKFIFNKIEELMETDITGLFKLANDFEEEHFLQRYEEKVLLILNQFVDKFYCLIPIFGLQFYNKKTDELFQNKGITTATFEDFKQFYMDCYEVAGELIRLVIAYNNLKYRQDYQSMKREYIQTLTNFDTKSKGTRIGLIDGSEEFDCLVYPYLKNSIRNAIGHNSYKYNGITQELVYYPTGHEDVSDEKRLYLLEFLQECWDLFQSVYNLYELVYQTRKLHFVSKGYSVVDTKVFDRLKNAGRNETCPCGSGKKFKRCCGKHD